MKQKDIDVFEHNGQELVKLALRLDKGVKLEEVEGRKNRSFICRARSDSIMAMEAIIKVVSLLLRR